MDEPFTRDILSNIAPKLDDETLARLYLVYQHSLRFILSTREFWYERAMLYVGHQLMWRPNANWKRIYYALKANDAVDWSEGRYTNLAVSDLDTFLTVEEAYGPLLSEDFESGPYTALLGDVGNVQLFEHLIALSGGREYSLWSILRDQIGHQNREMIDYLLPLIKLAQGSPVSAIAMAAAESDLVTLRYLLGNFELGGDDEWSLPRILNIAIEAGDLDVYRYLVHAYPDVLTDQEVLEAAASANSIDIFRYVFENTELSDDEKLALLDISVVEHDEVPFVFDYLITKIEDVDWEQLLNVNIDRISDKALKRVLPHIKLDSNATIEQLVDLMKGSRNRHSQDLIRALIRDPRARTETFSRDFTTKLYYLLVSGPGRPTDARGGITGYDVYSLILREMVLKRPSALELVNWMIELNWPELALVASSVLRGKSCPEELVSMRCLMLAMLYPTLTAQEQLDQLMRADASPLVIRETTTLLNEYDALVKK